MKKEDLEKGKELVRRISETETRIKIMTGYKESAKVQTIGFSMEGSQNTAPAGVSKLYTDETNKNLEYLIQLFRDNVKRILEKSVEDLKEEFELLGK